MASNFVLDSNDELWRDCAQWLTKWEMIRPDHKVNLPESKIVDFANVLRDGVVLCKLLNKIDPGCIDMKSVNLKPTMAQFLCLRNISIFLLTCINSFGLDKAELFEAGMLFDLSNFHKVLCTLSKISLHSKSQKSNIKGFYAQKEKTTAEEEIYQSLHTIEMPDRTRSVSDEYEDIYQEILARPSLKKVAQQQPHTFEKRDYVINELLETEKNYVEVLSKLRKNFMMPLQKCMDPEDFNTVFYKISDLHEIHCSFYSELAQLRNPIATSPKLSTIFMNYREKFLVYGGYCANLQKATTLLQELCDNPSNTMFNQEVMKHEKEVNQGRFKLRDVLSVPMQRILKYHLLLEKLIEHTSNNHEEYVHLTRTRETMLDVAGYINEVARDGDNLTVIKNVQETISEWSSNNGIRLEEYGRLIKDCELRIKAHDNNKWQNRYVFIFEKCIIVCKQQKGLLYRDLIKLQDFHIQEAHSRLTLHRDVRMMCSFILVANDTSICYNISVRTLELKNQLVKALKEAMDNLNPAVIVQKKVNHKLEYTTFEHPTTCNYCSKYLKGLLYQGYKCSKCHFGFHKQCIGNSIRCQSTNSWEGFPPIPDLTMREEEYDDDPLRDKLWFVGTMDRPVAEMRLRHRQDGTFLVRKRLQCDEKDQYALSLKVKKPDDDALLNNYKPVTHMKIMCTEPSSDAIKYYLSPAKYFNSIEELIMNYQHNCLKENFAGLPDDTKLLWSYKQFHSIAVRDFDPTDELELALTEGEEISIIGTEGHREGYYRGYNNNYQVGYFPKEYIKILGEKNFN